MRSKRIRAFAWILTVFIALSIVTIPGKDAYAAAGKISPVRSSWDVSISDDAYLFFNYTPSMNNTKILATLYAPNGSVVTSKSFTHSGNDSKIGLITFNFFVTGVYSVTLEEYNNITGASTGITSKVKMTVSGKKTGWTKMNGKKCYYDGNGKRLYGWQTIKGKRYHFDIYTGGMDTGWFKDLDGTRYHLDAEGVANTGWKTIGKRTYYFTKKGAAVIGWKKISGKKYYFGKTGVMATGWKTIDGDKYYFDKKGAMTVGWKKISGKKYYFKKGVMSVGWRTIEKKRYYFNVKGIMLTGWKMIYGQWYYLDKGAAVVNCSKVIGGKEYIFDKKGVCANKK